MLEGYSSARSEFPSMAIPFLPMPLNYPAILGIVGHWTNLQHPTDWINIITLIGFKAIFGYPCFSVSFLPIAVPLRCAIPSRQPVR
jgi:hypothetical protein